MIAGSPLQVTFELYESFANPMRDVDYPPYELTEGGWGEFGIVIKLHFHDDVAEPPLDLFHHLTLGLNEHGQGQKKPTVHEVYEEVVLWEPTEVFYNRLKGHQPRPAPGSQLSQYFLRFNPPADYNRIQHARTRLAQATARVKAQIAALDEEEENLGGEDGGGMDTDVLAA